LGCLEFQKLECLDFKILANMCGIKEKYVSFPEQIS